jgi:hypothetical protein
VDDIFFLMGLGCFGVVLGVVGFCGLLYNVLNPSNGIDQNQDD